MPLPTPILDDRSFEQLYGELRRRIPVYAPEWTDHNESDPGITLLQLFAYLGENLLYRFNQVPESTKLAFLRLLRIPLRPAMPAQALVAFTTEQAQGILIERRTAELKAGKLPFELDDDVYALPVSVVGVAKISAPEPTTPEARDAAQLVIDARDGLADDEAAAFYTRVELPAEPAAAGAAAVDLGAALDRALWIAVLDGGKGDVRALAGKQLTIGISPDEQIRPGEELPPCPGAGAAPAAPEIVWELWTGELRDGQPVFDEVLPKGTTRGLTRPGVVKLVLPDSRRARYAAIDPDVAGTGDLPPPFEDRKRNDKVLYWYRARRRDRGSPGRFLWVGANAACAVQCRTARPEFLGGGDAQADQVFDLVNRPVIEGSLALEVEEADAWVRWSEVDDFHASGEADRHYVLDEEAGRVRFGNGLQGRAPQLGERIRAKVYRHGGGKAGNVAAGAINKMLTPSSVKVQNPLAARGGADGESIEDALTRIPGEFRRHDRAVAPSDFQELALGTPGAAVGRAEVIPLYHPQKGPGSAGVVSVVVWPREDLLHPAAPLPDRTLLRGVCAWLDQRRLVTTELHVIPPVYRKIAVSVNLKIKPEYGADAVRHWVELVIRQFLAPLPPYGPDGKGWPLGRQVDARELEATALQVEGVEFVYQARVARWDQATSSWIEAQDPPAVTLSPVEVPELAALHVVDGETAVAPGAQLQPAVPPKQRIAIPTISEEC